MNIVKYWQKYKLLNKNAKANSAFETVNMQITRILDLHSQLGILDMKAFSDYVNLSEHIKHLGNCSHKDLEKLNDLMDCSQEKLLKHIQKEVTLQVNELHSVGTLQAISMVDEMLGLQLKSTITLKDWVEILNRNAKWLEVYHSLNDSVDAMLLFFKDNYTDKECQTIYRKLYELKELFYIRSLSDCEAVFSTLKEEIQSFDKAKFILIGALMRKCS